VRFEEFITLLIFFGPLIYSIFIRHKLKKENKKLLERNKFLEQFAEVANAREEAEKILIRANEKLYHAEIKDNEAQKYLSSVISEAKEQAAEIIKKAEAIAEEIKNNAKPQQAEITDTKNEEKVNLTDVCSYIQISENYKSIRAERNERYEKGKSIIDFPDEFCIVDLETTGFSPAKDYIIEIGAIKCLHDKVIDSFQSLINPCVKISPTITRITGITNEMVKNAPKIEDILPSFHNFLGNNLIVGHNVNFDVNFLYDFYMDYLGFPLRNDFIDLLRIARKLYPELPHHRLCDLLEYFNVETENLHRALGDCEATFICYKKFKNSAIEQYKTLETFLQSFKSRKRNL